MKVLVAEGINLQADSIAVKLPFRSGSRMRYCKGISSFLCTFHYNNPVFLCDLIEKIMLHTTYFYGIIKEKTGGYSHEQDSDCLFLPQG